MLSRSKGSSGLAEYLREASLFLRSVSFELRVGELSRAPLELLRFQVAGKLVSCDWLMREPDEWDTALPHDVGQRHASTQALHDALRIRALLFQMIRSAEDAELNAYARNSAGTLEPVIIGTTSRRVPGHRNIHSLVMRAKLVGFHFEMDGEVLRPLRIARELSADKF